MNEALVDACLKVARLTRELAEARAEMEAARTPGITVTADKIELTSEDGPRASLEQARYPRGLADDRSVD